MANILASSLDNFMVLNNSHSTSSPYVTFTVGNPSNVTITIKDQNNDDGFKKVISGSSTSVISSNSFRTGGVTVLNLLECLKLNSIFFNITLQGANVIKAFIDTSIKYNISVQGSGITVGGTYSSYAATSPNKMVVMMQGTIDGVQSNITMEKYNNDSTVSFNVTSPFQYTSLKYPVTFNVTAYQVYNDQSSTVSTPFNNFTVLPTTLHKFQVVDYGEYYGTGVKKFLTNNTRRRYNYGEKYGLSFLSDSSDISLKKNYYTNSGVFLETQTGYELREVNGVRTDFYDVLDIGGVETRFGRQVGYVNVFAVSGSTEVSEPIRFDVLPFCKDNKEVFFLNELGGLDSFNFGGESAVEMSLDNVSTYFRNPVRGFTTDYEIEVVKQKTNEIVYHLTTKQVDRETAEWLNELSKSKWAFRYLGISNPKRKTIIIDKLDIELVSSSDEFEIELEYHDSDNSIAV